MMFRMGMALMMLAAVGCGSEEKIDDKLDKLGRATGPVEPGGKPPMGVAPPSRPPGQPQTVHTGEVLETLTVPNYTYLRIKTPAGEEFWTAIPQAEVKVGDQVTVMQSVVMRDFHSRTLNRTFDSIVFGTMPGVKPPPRTGDAGPPPSALPAGHPPLGQPPAAKEKAPKAEQPEAPTN
jgi:hypothetical protein